MSETEIERRDFMVRTIDGVSIGIRQVRPLALVKPRVPFVLLHGTRPAGVSEYDLPVPNGSLAADLAAAGHVCFIPDARGYGRSDRPELMSRPPQESVPFARASEIVRDVDAAVDALRASTGAQRVALMGWGVGATVTLMYAALWREKVSHLVLYNPLYGGGGEHPRYRGHALEDPERPGCFNVGRYGGYSFNDPKMLIEKWNSTIPIENKDEWRDPRVAEAFIHALLESDPTSADRDPPSYRSPNGLLEDSLYMGKGAPLIHASQVYAKVLIIRPELDYFARLEDIAALRTDLVNAASVSVWEPRNATHFVILDRPERGRAAAIETILRFADD